MLPRRCFQSSSRGFRTNPSSSLSVAPHFYTLTSGKLLMWTIHSEEALCIGSPGKLPVWSPGRVREWESTSSGMEPFDTVRHDPL